MLHKPSCKIKVTKYLHKNSEKVMLKKLQTKQHKIKHRPPPKKKKNKKTKTTTTTTKNKKIKQTN